LRASKTEAALGVGVGLDCVAGTAVAKKVLGGHGAGGRQESGREQGEEAGVAPGTARFGFGGGGNAAPLEAPLSERRLVGGMSVRSRRENEK
jgi:hypothetical protein